MGYSQFKQKNTFPCHTVARISQIAFLAPAFFSPLGRRETRALSGRSRKMFEQPFFDFSARGAHAPCP